MQKQSRQQPRYQTRFGVSQTRKALHIVRALVPASLLMVLAACGMAQAAAPQGGWGAQWSPDGARIAFLSQRVGEPANLWVTSRSGGDARPLTVLGTRAFHWGVDSNTLYALTWRAGRLDWYRLGAKDGTAQRAWPWLPEAALDPTPSPDGRLNAYVLPAKEWHELWIVRADGKEAEKVSTHLRIQRPFWSPDGQRLAFEIASPHTAEWQTQVWIYALAKKDITRLRGMGTSAGAWSPDSKQLAVSLAMPPYAYSLGVCDVETQKSRALKKMLHTGQGVAWSPDGKMLGITTQGGGGTQITLLQITGTVTRRIGDAKILARFPQWSPDGKYVLFEGMDKGKSYTGEVWVAQVDGDEVQRLTPSAAADWAPVPSPDGKRVAFLTTRGHKAEAWVADADGRKPQRLADADTVSRLVWAPDGKSLLVLRKSGSVAVRFGAAPTTQDLKMQAALPTASWSPDGRKILYTGVEKGRTALMVHNVAGNTGRALLGGVSEKTPGDRHGAWDAQAKQVAFVRGAEVWVAAGDGKNPRRLAALAGDDLDIADVRWAPGGDRVLVTLTRYARASASWEMRAVDARGKVRVVVSEQVRSDFSAQHASCTSAPSWMAGGDVLFTSDRAGLPQAWRIRPAGGKPAVLLGATATYPALLPGGRLLFVGAGDGKTAIRVADTRTGAAGPWLK